MNPERFLDSFGGIRDDYVSSAQVFLGLTSPAEKPKRGRGAGKAVRILLIAAVLVSLLTTTAFAASEYLLNSPKQAVKAAGEQLALWHDMGVLSAGLEITEANTRVLKMDSSQDLGEGFFHRLLKPRYNLLCKTERYLISADIDMATGKLGFVSINAYAGENDTPIDAGEEVSAYLYYDNTDDILPDTLTVDALCSSLAEYWGFSGYTLSGTEDTMYGWSTDVPSGDTLVRDLADQPYLTVYFDGDQRGVPMFVELYRVAGATVFSIGTNHMLG